MLAHNACQHAAENVWLLRVGGKNARMLKWDINSKIPVGLNPKELERRSTLTKLSTSPLGHTHLYVHVYV